MATDPRDQCPFCGAWEIVVMQAEPKVWVCICHNCFAVGPPRATASEAVNLWNQRLLEAAEVLDWDRDDRPS